MRRTIFTASALLGVAITATAAAQAGQAIFQLTALRVSYQKWRRRFG